jgi:hypothetical protein
MYFWFNLFFKPFLPADRANIIHNIFQNAYSGKESYSFLVNVLGYLKDEKDLLPWRTSAKHVKDMVDIIQYRPSFYAVSVSFINPLSFLIFLI